MGRIAHAEAISSRVKKRREKGGKKAGSELEEEKETLRIKTLL